MWPSPAAQTTSNQYENSYQTSLRMSRSTVLIAAVIRSFMISIFAGRNGTQALSLTYTCKKKSLTVRFRNLTGQALLHWHLGV